MRILATAALSIFVVAATARADLIGTEIDVRLEHTGSLGQLPTGIGPSEGSHVYGLGNTDTFQLTLFGFPYGSWDLTSPPNIPVDAPVGPAIPSNILQIDLGGFDYTDFAGETSTFTLSEMAESAVPGSVTVFTEAGSIGQDIVVSGNGFSASWMADSVIGNPLLPSDPVVYVAWNSVPGPAALALFGLAGAVVRKRRRRA